MRTIHQSLLALAGATAALVLVTACNNERGTAPTTPLLSQAQAESLATTVVADVVGEIGTATMMARRGGGSAPPPPFLPPRPRGRTPRRPGFPPGRPPPASTPTTTAAPAPARFVSPRG